ncbi:MAG TPA: ABC transporter substrate-binding protein [Candidatus Acidoferrales bacterium]|nr:ABC transporter substrate-binding protein [Candidatus Acidoferrales bacterium]
MTSIRNIRFLAALCVVLAIGAGPAASAAGPFTIDVILSMTGSYAFVGSADAQGLKVFEDYANRHGGLRGQPIRFDVHDDQSSPQIAVQLSQTLVARHPAVVLGSNGGSLCSAMMPNYKDGPVMYCLVPSIYPQRGGYVFATQVALDPFVNGMIRYLQLRGWTRLAIVSSTDGSGQVDDVSTANVLKYPENRNVQIVDWEHFNPADINITAQATHVKGSNAQAIVVWSAGTAFGTVLRGLSDAGVTLPVETTNANMHAAQLAQYLSFYPKELVMPGVPYLVPNLPANSPLRAPIAEFFAAFKAANVKPEPGSAPFIWDAASIVLSGLRKLGPTATATELKNYILGLRNFAGIDGVYDFSRGDAHGLSDQSVVMASWNTKTQEFYAVSGMGGVPLKAAALTAP